jgi:hypothetical protein
MRIRSQIITRGKDRHSVRASVGVDEDGKRVYHNETIRRTKKDTLRYQASVLSNLGLGTFTDPSKETLNSYLDRWLANSVAPRVRERTLRDYRGPLERYVRTLLGQRILASIESSGIRGSASANAHLDARHVEGRGDTGSRCRKGGSVVRTLPIGGDHGHDARRVPRPAMEGCRLG